MAYFSQEHKAKLAPTIKAICKKYGVKATLSVRNHMSLVLTVKQGNIDFIGNYVKVNNKNADDWAVKKGNIDVNVYHYKNHFDGRARDFLAEVVPAMHGPDYFDESDIQTDYFHCSHYVDVNIGRWDAPYALEK
jgi:hypothetical protein